MLASEVVQMLNENIERQGDHPVNVFDGRTWLEVGGIASMAEEPGGKVTSYALFDVDTQKAVNESVEEHKASEGSESKAL